MACKRSAVRSRLAPQETEIYNRVFFDIVLAHASTKLAVQLCWHFGG